MKYKIIISCIFFTFVLVCITACSLNNFSEDIVGYELIKTSIPKVTLKDTRAKTGSNGVSYTERTC